MLKRKLPMHRYWSLIFFTVMAVGLSVALWTVTHWMKQQALHDRLALMEYVAEETATSIAMGHPDAIPQDLNAVPLLTKNGSFVTMPRVPTIYVTDSQGVIRLSNDHRRVSTYEVKPSILHTEAGHLQWKGSDRQLLHIVKQPIFTRHGTIGYVLVLEEASTLQQLDRSIYGQIIVFGLLTLLIGFATIFWIARRMTVPIQRLVTSVESIERGDYEAKLDPSIVREAEIAHVMESFNRMASKLDQLEHVRTQLLAGVTHELKTPLTSVGSLLQAIRDGVATGELREEFIDLSLEELEKMKRLTDDLVKFNEFATGDVPLQISSISLPDLFQRVARRYDTLDIVIHCPARVVSTDPLRLEQIVTNLLNNSRDAEATRVVIDVWNDEQRWHVRVRDDGIGICEEEVPYIFEKFYRGEKKKFQREGFGLGLSLSELLAQSLNGTLQLVETSAEGTTFECVWQEMKAEAN